MALKLTKNSLATPGIHGAQSADADRLAQREAAAVRELVDRAAITLTGGGYDRYAALFDEAAALASPHRRYQARKLLVEQALVTAQRVGKADFTELLVAAARGTVAALEETPAEPFLLNYAGVLFHELWSLDAAAQLFEAARRLDPEVPHLDGNIRGVAARRRERRGQLVLHPTLRTLAARAVKVARAARPATGQRISLCMIVKDEEEMLPRSLAAIAPAVDEMIVVDTGSSDGTIEIARSFGATVIERDWTGSFSDARNVSLEAATGDWFIFLDADEVLVEADVQQLRALAGKTWHEAFFLLETNFTGTEDVGLSVQHSALRMFRNRPEYRFMGRLHEQIAHRLPGYLPERVRQSSVRVDHYGYLGAVRDSKEKSKRNIELLLAQQREAPTDGFFHYNLGSEYFAAGQPTMALAEFERSWEMVQANGAAKYEFVPSLLIRLVITLRHLGRHERVMTLGDSGLERFPGFTDLIYEQGLSALALGRIEEGAALLEQAIEMGDAPSRYTAILGAGTFLPRIALGTLQMNLGRVDQAVELLRWCIDNNPDFFGTVHPYASALMKAGNAPDDVVAEVERKVSQLSPTYRFMLGVALYEQDAPAAAETQFRHVLERQPQSAAARAALVESLLYQRRYADAAQEAQLVPEDDSVARTVLRSELFARLLGGDTAGAVRALMRSQVVGLPAADQEVFDAWLAPAREFPLSAQSAPLLQLMLESLLRVQDFDNFETVLGLWQRTTLPHRDRRERLAQIYLRRGYLRSAAREWMAVCEHAPDVAALLGLARVAVANGQSGTALTFAEQALALEPHSPVARQLVQACSSLAVA